MFGYWGGAHFSRHIQAELADPAALGLPTFEETLAQAQAASYRRSAFSLTLLAIYANVPALRARLLTERPLLLLVARQLLDSCASQTDSDPVLDSPAAFSGFFLQHLLRLCSPQQKAAAYSALRRALAEANAERSRRPSPAPAVAAEAHPPAGPRADLPGSVPVEDNGGGSGAVGGLRQEEARTASPRVGRPPPSPASPPELCRLLFAVVGRSEFPSLRRGWAANALESLLDADWSELEGGDAVAGSRGAGSPKTQAAEREPDSGLQDPVSAHRARDLDLAQNPVVVAARSHTLRAGLLQLIQKASPWSRRAPVRVLSAAARGSRGHSAVQRAIVIEVRPPSLFEQGRGRAII